MYLGKSDVNTFEKGTTREILATNGRRGYAFTTVIGVNTRREHGLLVVPPEGNGEHQVLVSKLDETVVAGGRRFLLSTNQYRDMVYPDGFRYIQEYSAHPLPSILFVIHSVFIRKTIFMVPDHPQTVIKYEILSSPERIQIELRPLLAHRQRDFPGESQAGEVFSVQETENRVLAIEGRGARTFLGTTAGDWFLKELWFEGLLYGGNTLHDHDTEDLWSPGYLTLDAEAGESVFVVLSNTPLTEEVTEALCRQWERDAASPYGRGFPRTDQDFPLAAARELAHTATSLVMPGGPSGPPAILSGYPSVRERARDTFIALPGLTLASGRTGIAGAVLDRWLQIAERCGGIMPGEILPDGTPIFGPVDAGLWFFYALDKYCHHVGSFDKIRLHWNALKVLAERYTVGIPALDVACDQDGFLFITSVNPIRHWMSGIVAGEPVVSRRGALVEVNALWYNALRALEHFADIVEDSMGAKIFGQQADRIRTVFTKKFLYPSGGYLYDWIDGEERDEAIRPNQILAISLPSSPLEPEVGRSVLEICWNELYTTYGLRTLDAHAGKYKGRSEGRWDQRRKAWYRGMAWPWLLGQFVSAFLRYNPDRGDMGAVFLRPFSALGRSGGLGSVAELFDGSMPYEPHGDVVSAISVGEILRVLDEDFCRSGRI